ncbi:hypothetical protein J2Z44_001048 [Clostridium punense]|uniref:Uncharacterized protein n=1 Tax=Clostridium punense TaxID=1054297 RepID=A0ABS4K0E7_9CLOT|nr:hypothetical protein M918_00685 [Clostridium sp. BL8]MBP2021257.1 hypothetical protein [Clostridium punense]
MDKQCYDLFKSFQVRYNNQTQPWREPEMDIEEET